jgi:hypothetical protein
LLLEYKMLHKNGNIIRKVAIPPYRPFEWKLSEMKQKKYLSIK